MLYSILARENYEGVNKVEKFLIIFIILYFRVENIFSFR